jgi:hypothetical protein
MSKPVIIVLRQNPDANITVVRIDISYTHSFCEHLTKNNIRFERSEAQFEEWGLDRQKVRWDIVSNEVIIHKVGGLIDLISSWDIPQFGLGC